VHWLKKTVAVMLLALWSVASNHCQLETLPGLSFLECAPAATTESHCDDSECAGVESGGYKVESHQSLLPVVITAVDLAQLILPAESSQTEATSALLVTVAPPEFPHCWQFVFRAAAAPRSPSLAS
jgi:hypothetical protein